MVFKCVEPHDTATVWFQVQDLLASALDHEYGSDLNFLYKRVVLDNAYTMWVWTEGGAPRAVVLTRISHRPCKRVLEITHVAGEGLWEIGETILHALELYARLKGCQAIETGGKGGWDRWLKPKGYVKAYTIVRKEF